MKPKISVAERLLSAFLDHIFMTIIAFVFFIPLMATVFSDAFKVTHDPSSIEIFKGPWVFVGLLGFSIYFSRDCINGRSIAKRILRLQVVDNRSGQVASPLKCFLRNLTIVVWPIEIIAILSNPERRIGDLLAGTKVVSTLPAPLASKTNIKQLIIVGGLSYCYVLILSTPFYILDKHVDSSVKFIASSYDMRKSKQLDNEIHANLRDLLKPDVRVYDSIQNQKEKYVSIICKLKENYEEEDPQQLGKIHDTIEKAIILIFPGEKILGQVKYVYENGDVLNIRVIDIKLG
jgi:uncharacterized RDD family membrane protein YckC